jgi:hypothetical protein
MYYDNWFNIQKIMYFHILMNSLLYTPKIQVVKNQSLFEYSKMSTLNSIKNKNKKDSLERNNLIITCPFEYDSGRNNPEINTYRLLAYLSLSLTTIVFLFYKKHR